MNPGLVVDDTNWEIPFRCITLGEEVGSGAYGSIHRGEIACEHQKEPIEVAVKLLKSESRINWHKHASLVGCSSLKSQSYMSLVCGQSTN